MTCFNRMAYHYSHDHEKSTLHVTQLQPKKNERNHKLSMVACKGQVTESRKTLPNQIIHILHFM